MLRDLAARGIGGGEKKKKKVGGLPLHPLEHPHSPPRHLSVRHRPLFVRKTFSVLKPLKCQKASPVNLLPSLPPATRYGSAAEG